MQIRIKKSELPLKIGLCIFLPYLLMRPFINNYVSGYYRYLFMVIVAVGCLFCIFAEKSISKIGSLEFILLFIFYIYAFMDAFWWGGTELVSYTVERYIFYTFPIFIIPVIADKINWKNIFIFLSIFGVIDAVISIIEFITQVCLFPMSDGETTIEKVTQAGDRIIRTYGLQGNYFLLAEILCVCGLASYFLFKFEKIKWQIIPLIIISIGVLTTGTRGYYVSYAVGILFIYFFERRDKGISFTMLLRLLFFIIVIAIFAYIIIGTNITTGISYIDTVLKRIRMVFDWTGDSSNIGRLSRWQWAINYWKESWLFGHGACCTDTRYSGYIAVTESGVLKRMVELGLIGTILQYLTLFIPLFKGIRRYRKGEIGSIAILFFAILISFFAEDFILQRYTAMEYTIIMWISLSYLAYSKSENTGLRYE